MLGVAPGFHLGAGPVSGWAEAIEAVEAVGWRLTEWSVVNDKHDRPHAYPLFRRA